MWLSGHGVLLDGSQGMVSNTLIAGNLIGTTPDPDVRLGNNYGVTLLSGVSDNTIAGNVIAGNNIDGIWAGAGSGFTTGPASAAPWPGNAVGSRSPGGFTGRGPWERGRSGGGWMSPGAATAATMTAHRNWVFTIATWMPIGAGSGWMPAGTAGRHHCGSARGLEVIAMATPT